MVNEAITVEAYDAYGCCLGKNKFMLNDRLQINVTTVKMRFGATEPAMNDPAGPLMDMDDDGWSCVRFGPGIVVRVFGVMRARDGGRKVKLD